MRLPPHVSKIKRKNINEALVLWNKKSRKTIKQREEFASQMLKRGWKHSRGGDYKNCLIKDSIVAKYIYSPSNKGAQNEIKRELQQWQQVPYRFRRHLPITYTLHKGLMI